MINLENRIERDELIDDYFNKGYACDIREVYQAIVNTIADLEYANDEKSDEIERLNNIIKYLEQYFSEREYYEFAQLVRETKQANIEWLKNAIKEEK